MCVNLDVSRYELIKGLKNFKFFSSLREDITEQCSVAVSWFFILQLVPSKCKGVSNMATRD